MEMFPKTVYDFLMKIIDQIKRKIEDKTNINELDKNGSVTDSIEIELPPGAYELVDKKNAIQQELTDCCSPEFKINIAADTISMKSVLTTSSSIHFNSEFKKFLGITKPD